MSAAYKTFGLVAAALFVAIASFQDSLALGMAQIGLLLAATAMAMLMLGAAFSLISKGARGTVDTTSSITDEDVDIETSHS